jgi:hypothetical protein
MEATVTTANSEGKMGGGNEPMGSSYKLMMWFFYHQML